MPQEKTRQLPIQRWLVLTEFGVELQPIGNKGIVQQFAKNVRPYRRQTTIVNENEYRRLHA